MMKYGGVIAAAGLSSRMGAFKPLLPVGERGQTILSRTAAMMREAGAEQIIIVTGFQGELIEERLKAASDIIFLRNKEYESTQMFDSICMGLRYLRGSCGRVLLSPGDVPLVKRRTVQALMEQPGRFVCPVYAGKRGHPVILDGELIPAVLAHDGTEGLLGAIKANQIEIAEVEVGDPNVLLDADTREDYEEILRRTGQENNLFDPTR